MPSPPRTARVLSATWLVVSTPARIASSDRHSVAVACLPRFRLLGPLSLTELGGPLVLVGALTRPSNGRLF